MSEVTNANNGMALVEQKQYEKGIELLTKALKVRQSPLWLLSRCKAYQNTKRLDEALADADLAYVLATERQGAQSQAQRAEAQYRRAVIYYKKGHFADSDACCVWSMQILEGRKFISSEDDVAGNVDSNGQYRATVEDAKNRKSMLKESAPGSGAGQPNESRPDWARAYVWRTQALTAMEALGQGDPGRKLTAQRVPAKPVFDEGLETKPKVKEVVSENKLEAGDVVTSAPKAAAGAPKPKLRVDFYQTDKTVNLTLYIKGVVKDELKVTENDTTIAIRGLPKSDKHNETVVLQLASRIKPSASSTFKATPYKLEFTLEKAEVGVKWGSWGSQLDQSVTANFADFADFKKDHGEAVAMADSAGGGKDNENSKPASHGATKPVAGAEAKKPSGPPAYPSSAKGGPKNWETLAVPGEDEETGDANHFFKQLFAGSTPDQQRAMMKSFTESNGTALSTDWNDVKSRKVETLPPDGVEAKKW